MAWPDDNNDNNNFNFGYTDFNRSTPSMYGSGDLQYDPQSLAKVGAGSFAPTEGVVPGLSFGSFDVAKSPAQFSSPASSVTPSMWEKFIGSKEAGPGIATPLMGLAQGGMNFYLGKRGLDLAEDQLKMQKQQFADQFGAQKKQINMDIYDQGQRRSDRRVGATPSAQEYFEKNRL